MQMSRDALMMCGQVSVAHEEVPVNERRRYTSRAGFQLELSRR